MSNNSRKRGHILHFLFSLTIVLFFLPDKIWGFETNDFQIHMKITNMIHAEAPSILEDHIFLSYESSTPVRFVGAAFSHEKFSQIHSFVRNSYNVFVIAYPVPKNLTEVDYRIVVDGLWMADPHNSNIKKDNSGIYLSRLILPEKEVNRWKIITPVIEGSNTVTFYYFGPPGKNIYLSGSFNNWDPFTYKFNETGPGEYSFSLQVLPGEYFYYFLMDGLFFLDPLNPNKGSDPEGYEVSMFNTKKVLIADNSKGSGSGKRSP